MSAVCPRERGALDGRGRTRPAANSILACRERAIGEAHSCIVHWRLGRVRPSAQLTGAYLHVMPVIFLVISDILDGLSRLSRWEPAVPTGFHGAPEWWLWRGVLWALGQRLARPARSRTLDGKDNFVAYQAGAGQVTAGRVIARQACCRRAGNLS